MARLLGNELPDDLYQRLRGRDLEERADKVILISTVDEQGWPHPAMLSYFEVIAKDRRTLRLATYTNSNTTQNMRRTGRATLSIIEEHTAYYVKGIVTELRREMLCTPHNSKLSMVVEQVLADEVDEEFEPGAYVASGVTYRNPNRGAQLAQARAVLSELLIEEVAVSF